MKKIRKRLALDKHILRELTATDTAQVAGGVVTSIGSIHICVTQQICPSRRCTIDVVCPI
jgi:hypothetical protein